MDRGQAKKIAEALLEPERRRQSARRQSRLQRQWNGEGLRHRNRRALRLAIAAIAAGVVVGCIAGVFSIDGLAAPDTWKRLLAWVGLPAWLVGLWWFRPPPRPGHVEEL